MTLFVRNTTAPFFDKAKVMVFHVLNLKSNRFQYNRWQRRNCTLSVQLYFSVTSVILVLVSDKIIKNSDYFRRKCFSYSETNAIFDTFSYISLLLPVVLYCLFGGNCLFRFSSLQNFQIIARIYIFIYTLLFIR